MKIFNNTFYNQFAINVDKFHSVITKVPLRGEYLEEVLTNTFRDLEIEYNWDAGSHRVGADIEVPEGNISVKGGTMIKDGLKISSFRTTKYKTLQEKIEYLDDPKEDITFSCSYNKDTDSYHIFLITDKVVHKDINWETSSKKHSGKYKNIDVDIRFSMSDQVWYTYRGIKEECVIPRKH